MNKVKMFFKNLFSAKTWKKVFSLSGWKRWFLSLFILTGAVASIVAGTTAYTSKNVKKSVEYDGGQEFLIEIKNRDKNSKIKGLDIANSIQSRINDGSSFSDAIVSLEGNDNIKISKSGRLSADDRKKFESLVTTKSTLIFTDVSGQPLFRNGVFVQPTENNKIDWEDVISRQDASEVLRTFVPPISSARHSFNSFGSNAFVVEAHLKNRASEAEWTKLTDYLSKKPNGEKFLLTWLNIDELVKIARSKYSSDWSAAQKNPYNFVYVGQQPRFQNQEGILKLHSIKADRYLVNKVGVNRPLNGDRFIIGNNASGEPFNEEAAKQLAEEINYGTSQYDLEVVSSNFITAESTNNAFALSLIAIGVVFTFLAIMLLVNYGLLGALSTISIALYVFLTLTLFTVLRGEYSPITFGAVLIGLAISFDANVVTLSRLKQELYRGEKMRKAVATTMRSTLPSLLDSNILILLASFVMFYLGLQDIRNFSISIVFSVLAITFATLFITRLCTTLIANTKLFINHPRLCGLRPKKLHPSYQPKLQNFNFIAKAKWFLWASLIFVVVGIIIYSVFAGINKDFAAGFSRAIDFRGGTDITIQGREGSSLNEPLANQIRQFLIQNAHKDNFKEIANLDKLITLNPLDQNRESFSLVIKTTQQIPTHVREQFKFDVINNFGALSLDVLSFGVSASESLNYTLFALYAILASIGIAFVYILIRYRWTYAISVVVSILFEFILVLAFLAITRLYINKIAIVAIASLILFSLSDKISLIAKVKEITSLQAHNAYLNNDQILAISNKALRANLKRSLFNTIILILINLIATLFIFPIDFSFTITLIFASLVVSLCSMFVTMSIWNKLEMRRQRGIEKRHKEKYWALPGNDEQIFAGINDFIA